MSGFRPVLVVIDVQNGFVNAGSAHVVPVIADLAARWLDAGGPVIFTRYRNHPGSPFERLIGWSGLQDEQEVAFAPQVAPLTERAVVIGKTTYSALTDEMRALIAEHGYTDLFLCGIASEGCVLASALAAFDAGLVPWVLTDACASNASRMPAGEAHAAGLMLIARLTGAGQLISAAEALGRVPAAVPVPD